MASSPGTPISYAELEIRIDRRSDGAHTMRMALESPATDSSLELARSEIGINSELLRELGGNTYEYGRALGNMLFGDERAQAGLAQAQARARSQGVPLRILLQIDSAVELQALRWESIIAPGSEQPLALNEQVLLARFVSGIERAPLQPRLQATLRILAVIAAPYDLETYGLGPIDVDALQKRIYEGLQGLDVEMLAAPTATTPEAIVEHLSTGYDILYLIAHGVPTNTGAGILLTNSEGAGEPAASDFVERVAQLSAPPRLVVLSAAQAAERPTDESPSSFGYQLAAAGIPAVVETRADFSLESAVRLTSPLLHELQRDGQVDRALAAARRQLADREDWWMPVLLTSVRSGQLWGDGPVSQEASPVQRKGGQAHLEPPIAQSAAEPDPYDSEAPADSPLEQPALSFEQAAAADPTLSPEQIAQEASAAPPLPFANGPLPTPPAGAAPAVAQPPTIAVLVQRLEERYRPPAETLCIEIHDTYVHFRHHNVDYTSPHALEAQQADLIASLALDPLRHGELLFAAIFRDAGQSGAQSTRIGYEQALARADRELRVELNIYAPEHNRWRWEYLRDPNRPGSLPLATSQRSPLYRRPPIGRGPAAAVAARPLKICAAICSPPGLGDPANALLKGLAPIAIDRQEQIIRAALEPLREAGLAEYRILGGQEGPPATFEAIGAELDAGCHVLHLLAHGAVVKDAYQLVIENDRDASNKRPFVSADDIIQSLDARGAALRLVLLAACQSASAARAPGDDDSLGAALVTGGVPAVIAMQDLVAVNTVQFFTQRFYADLARSGRVDMAVAATRYDLYEWLGGGGADWGIPVLYMGPGDGQLFDVDLARAASRLPDRPPVISSFAEPVADDGQIARRVAEIMSGRPAGPLSPPQVDALRAAVAPAGAPDLARLAPEQDRAALGRLRRPLAVRADELKAYVEAQPDRLALERSVYSQLAAALSIGKHIILTGPPGTGKTSLAQHICRFAAERSMTQPAVFTTASADWTTFDTVGGYVPTPQGTLQFRPGIFLRALGEGRWLVIDEINRAEIDKAFGELFTVLSGQQVDLPYWIGQQQVRIIPGLRGGDVASPWVPASVSSPYDYVVHPNWRIIGAMNVFDRSSLFALSFALMRRFAFIELDVPAPQIYRDRLLAQWLAGRPFPAAAADALTDLAIQLLEAPTLMNRRALGPAIIKDLVQHMAHDAGTLTAAGLPERLAEAFTLYAVPQLDALDQEAIAAIYSELQAIFGPGPTAALMLARIRGLYPHMRRDEWPQ